MTRTSLYNSLGLWKAITSSCIVWTVWKITVQDRTREKTVFELFSSELAINTGQLHNIGYRILTESFDYQ